MEIYPNNDNQRRQYLQQLNNSYNNYMNNIGRNNDTHIQNDSFFSLSRLDAELQSAQYIIQQDMIAPWEDFNPYLAPVNSSSDSENCQTHQNLPNSPTHSSNDSCNSTDYTSDNDKIKLELTSPDQPSLLNSPPFDGADLILNGQEKSHLFSDQTLFHNNSTSAISTPLETPLDHPSNNSFLNPLNSQFNYIIENNSKNNLTIDSIFSNLQQPVTSDKDILQQLNTSIKPLADTKKKSISNTTFPQQKKSAHNAIERRYRNNINDRINELKNAVPALLYAKVKDNTTRPLNTSNQKRSHQDDDDDDDGEEYIDGVAVATKLNKATILRKATEYIVHLKRQEEDMKQENSILQHLLSQLPGGSDVLNRYQSQKLQHEQELQRQRQQQRLLEKQIQQQNRKSYRKKSRHESVSDSNHQTFIMPTVNNKQQSMSNRVFMAVFMAISFFSSSPLSAGSSIKNQFDNHNHISRATNQSFNENAKLNTLFNIWPIIRTIIFIICLSQLLFPSIRFWFSFNFKKTQKNDINSNKKKSNSTQNIASSNNKYEKLYKTLVKSLELNPTNKNKKITTVQPQQQYSTIGFYFVLVKEITHFACRHLFGYEYNKSNSNPQEQWIEACKWIKLNEIECLGGNHKTTRASMLYSCIHMLNLVEQLQDVENDCIQQSLSRVYATAAMQMSLIFPQQGLAKKLSNYFWHLSMIQPSIENDKFMKAFLFNIPQNDNDCCSDSILSSHAWNETISFLNQQLNHIEKVEDTSSLITPVLVPVDILSTFHLLDVLKMQFSRLVISATEKPLTNLMVKEEMDFFLDDALFSEIMDMTSNNDGLGGYHDLAHWFAVVGATINTLWKNDVKNAANLIKQLSELETPCSLLASQRKTWLNEMDKLTKQSMIHILVGATLLKQKGNQLRGIEELEKAEKIKLDIKNLMKHNKMSKDTLNIENNVLELVEFVTVFTGLIAWISVWRLAPVLTKCAKDRDIWVATTVEKVHNSGVNLRRMVRNRSLDGLHTNQVIIERLSRLCTYISNQIDDVDSACECNDDVFDETQEDDNYLSLHRSNKALEILCGFS